MSEAVGNSLGQGDAWKKMGQAVSGLSNDEVRCCLPASLRFIKVDISSDWMFYQRVCWSPHCTDIYIYTCYFCLLKGLGWMANGQDALLQRHHLQDIVESVHVCHTSCSSTAQVGSWFKDVANSGWCLVGLGPSHKTLQIATAKGQTNTMKHSYMRAHSRPLQMSSINIFIFVKSLEYWVRDTTTELASLEEGLANVFCSFIWVWWTFCLHIGTIKPQGLSSWWVHVCGQGVWNLARSCKIKYYCKG